MTMANCQQCGESSHNKKTRDVDDVLPYVKQTCNTPIIYWNNRDRVGGRENTDLGGGGGGGVGMSNYSVEH